MPVKAFISIKNLLFNAKAIKDALPKSVKFCAVVKADAYGHGAEKVASALYPYADCFAVATPKEGVALRVSGIDKEILVLTKTFAEDAGIAARYGLTLTVSDLNDLKIYSRAAKKAKTCVRVHIKYDTGMNRQGLSGVKELSDALLYIKTHKSIELCGLYSHFALPEDDISRNSAISKFLVAKKIVKGYNKNAICHISASGGFLKGEFFDMVRVGILLYGYKPFPADGICVRKVMKVYAPVVKVRRLKKGEPMLYGEKRSEIARTVFLVRYGYADGLNRKEIAGQFNNRCMDVTAVTERKAVRRIDGAEYVAVMDDAEKLARAYKTISYEILVKCALRAEKIYVYR